MTIDNELVQPARKGRPPGKRGTFSFRVTATLRTQLEVAAAKSERPVSEEIEYRLEKSFWKDEFDKQDEFERENYSAVAQLRRLESMCGGRENFEFSWFVGEQLKGIRMKLGIEAGMPINDVPVQDRRRMMEELIAALPLRFGVFDTEQS